MRIWYRVPGALYTLLVPLSAPGACLCLSCPILTVTKKETTKATLKGRRQEAAWEWEATRQNQQQGQPERKKSEGQGHCQPVV
jgi:hypothetical protein